MPPSTRKLVVFDASPVNDPTPWMRRACLSADVFLADINAIADVLAADPQAQKILIARGPTGEDSQLAEYYRTALDKLAAGKPRVAVHSVVWIDYGLVPEAAVLDFDNLEADLERALERHVEPVFRFMRQGVIQIWPGVLPASDGPIMPRLGAL